MADSSEFKRRLVTNLPRDRSGPRSADRFVFQQNWALCKLMSLHEAGEDYLISFDHHEDVQVMDSEETPSQIEGYQIKTKGDGNWTVRAVTKQEEGTADPPSFLPSILGKLYSLKLLFPSETNTLQFVSNAPIRAKLQIDGKTQTKDVVLFEEFADNVKADIHASLQKELALTEPPVLEGLLQFAVTDIPLKEHNTYVTGKLANFLDHRYPGRPFRIVAIYRALLSEVAVRNNNQEPIATYDDLVHLKSISRTRFEEILVAAGVSLFELKWDTIEGRLNSENAPLPLVQGLKREWENVTLDRISRADVLHLRLWEIVSQACVSNQHLPTLLAAVEAAYLEVISNIDPSWPFSEMYLKTAVILGIYEPQ